MTTPPITASALDKSEKPTVGLMGIYKITNTRNGKIYVGATTSFHTRFKRHIEYLNSGRHECREMVTDWETDKELFRFEFVEFVQKVSQLFEREDYWLKKASGEGLVLYNRKKNLGLGRSHLFVRPSTRVRLLDLGFKTMDQAVNSLIDCYEEHHPITTPSLS